MMGIMTTTVDSSDSMPERLQEGSVAPDFTLPAVIPGFTESGSIKVVPEFLRTLVFARPRGDDQFADCTFSPSLDMSR